jgi:ABC-type phosphate transport system substrate-binding protein
MKRKLIVALLLASLASLISVGAASAQTRDLAVVVHPSNAVANISSADLRKIFAGQKHSWPGGIPIKVIVRGPGCHERLVLLKLLGISESEYKQYWSAQVFRGEADAEPLAVPSFGMTKEAVLALPGSISLVESQSVKPGMNMKVVKVDGRLPGEPGYPLH